MSFVLFSTKLFERAVYTSSFHFSLLPFSLKSTPFNWKIWLSSPVTTTLTNIMANSESSFNLNSQEHFIQSVTLSSLKHSLKTWLLGKYTCLTLHLHFWLLLLSLAYLFLFLFLTFHCWMPQKSVLEPPLCMVCVRSLGDLTHHHDFKYILCEMILQVYISSPSLSWAPPSCIQLPACVSA